LPIASLPESSINVPTLQDISLDAGVSIKTVSRALRGEGYVAQETLARVQASARKLGYRPNRAARGLKMGRLQEVVLVIWSIDDVGESSEMLMAKIRALDEALREGGLPLTIRLERGGGWMRPRFPEKLIADLEAERPLGVVFLATDVSILERAIGRLEAVGVAALVLDGLEPGAFDNVAVDRGAGIVEAIQYLYEIGRREIFYVGIESPNRLDGYRAGISAVGLEPRYHYLFNGVKSEILFQQGRDAARHLMTQDRRPDAVITYSDPIALGMVDALKELGMVLPRDLSVVGFDDKKAAVLTTPRLTTIAHPNAEVGAAAGEILLKKIKGAAVPEGGWSVSFPARLVIRESA